ncbi:MAG: peroxiredoxin [Legionella sp.]|nr:peroxiredoxin [Legionella sp.]
MKIGDKIPNIAFKATNNILASFDDYQGKWLVLYFYPKDQTPGCTIESHDFRDTQAEFKKLNAVVFGISRDSLKSHDNFICKQALSFDLISDEAEELCQLFDVIKMKSMYGKQVRGIERSTFLINPQGILTNEWRKVKVAGHVDDVLATLKASQNQ